MMLSPGIARRAPQRVAALLLLVVAAGSTALGGCQPPSAGQGPGHRSQTLALTPEEEVALGRQAYREILHKADGHVLRGGPQVERVRRIGQRIEQAVQIEPLRRELNLRLKGYSFEWEYNVIDSPQVNAFCLPGGKVAVFTGLLPLAQTDDELATVLSHEIAHALAHHASERIARQRKLELAARAAGGAFGSLDPRHKEELTGLLSASASFGALAFDRQQESEADHIGVFLMTFAGYDPEKAIVFWDKMQRHSAHTGRPPEILSDHPSDARRIAQLRQWVPRAEGAKRAYEHGRIAPAAASR